MYSVVLFCKQNFLRKKEEGKEDKTAGKEEEGEQHMKTGDEEGKSTRRRGMRSRGKSTKSHGRRGNNTKTQQLGSMMDGMTIFILINFNNLHVFVRESAVLH